MSACFDAAAAESSHYKSGQIRESHLFLSSLIDTLSLFLVLTRREELIGQI